MQDFVNDSTSDDDSVSSTETSAQGKDPSCTLYVGKRFPSYIRKQQIRDHFAALGFGDFITNVVMPVDKATGSTKGFGFVTFTSPKAAEDAISIVNGTSILDKYKVHAKTYKRKKKPQHPRKKPQVPNPPYGGPHPPYRGPRPPHGGPRPPFEGPQGINPSLLGVQIHNMSLGNLPGPGRQRKDNPKATKGPGAKDFVNDSSSDDDSVCSTETSAPSCTLYVGKGFPSYIREQQIRDHFAALGFGDFITNVVVPVDKASGSTKGFGFVTFTSPKAAEDAISIVNGTSILDKYKVYAEAYKRKKKPQHPRKKPQPHNPTSTIGNPGQGRINMSVGKPPGPGKQRGGKPRSAIGEQTKYHPGGQGADPSLFGTGPQGPPYEGPHPPYGGPHPPCGGPHPPYGGPQGMAFDTNTSELGVQIHNMSLGNPGPGRQRKDNPKATKGPGAKDFVNDSSSDDDSVSSTETSAQEKDPSRTLYVGKGFPSYIREQQIREHFAALGFGAFITNVVMPVDKATGSTKGFGFVTFTSPKAAEDAISIVNGTSILDKYKVHAETYKRKKKPQHPRKKSQPHNPTSTKLGQGVIDVYVGGDIPNHIKNDHIRAHFKDYEAFITNAMVVRDPQTKKTKGYAIVTFSSVDAAHDAILKLNGSLLHGKFPLVLEEAQKHSINNVVSMVTTPADGQVPPAVSSQTSASIIISNLPSSVSEKSIGLLLGGIQHKSCHIDSEASKTVLELFSVDDARAAVSKLDGITLLGQVINVSVGKPPGPGKQRGGKPRSAKGEQTKYHPGGQGADPSLFGTGPQGPPYGGPQGPPYGGPHPPYGGPHPPYAGPYPPYGGPHPTYGGPHPPYGGPHPPYGGPQGPPYGGQQFKVS